MDRKPRAREQRLPLLSGPFLRPKTARAYADRQASRDQPRHLAPARIRKVASARSEASRADSIPECAPPAYRPSRGARSPGCRDRARGESPRRSCPRQRRHGRPRHDAGTLGAGRHTLSASASCRRRSRSSGMRSSSGLVIATPTACTGRPKPRSASHSAAAMRSRRRAPASRPRSTPSMNRTSSSPSRVCARIAATRPLGRPPGFPLCPGRKGLPRPRLAAWSLF